MVGPHSSDRERGDSDQSKDHQTKDQASSRGLIPVGIKQSDLYAPIFLELVECNEPTLHVLKNALPEFPWSVITEYLLPRMRRSETIEIGGLIGNVEESKPVVINQQQKFLLIPSIGAEHSEHRISITGGEALLTGHVTPEITLVKRGTQSLAISARIKFSKQTLEERWNFVDYITQFTQGVYASAQRAEAPFPNFKIVAVRPGINLGLTSLIPELEPAEEPSHAIYPSHRVSWVPLNISVRDPLYSDQRVVASHAFNASAPDIVRSGLLPHLEAFVEQERGISLPRLSRMARLLPTPLRVSVWRGYVSGPAVVENLGEWVASDEKLDSSVSHESRSSVVVRHQLFSRAEIMGPLKVDNPRPLVFLGASAQSEFSGERLRVLGRLRLAFLPSGNPVGSNDRNERELADRRWDDLLRLMHDLESPVTKDQFIEILTEVRVNELPEGTKQGAIGLTIQDPSDPGSTRAITPCFGITRAI